MKKICTAIGLFIFLGRIIGQPSATTPNLIDLSNDTLQTSTPFYGGLHGYYSFRIPTLIKTKSALVAFAEGRKNSTSDFGDIDIVYRRSVDNGKTWEDMKILYDLDTLAVQNPVPVYVPSENKLIVLFNTTSLSEHDVLHKDYGPEKERNAFMAASLDDGLTWQNPLNITRSVKLPHWRWHSLGPVHGIELQHPKHQGRLLVPVAISIAKGNRAYCMALIFSDDKGNTWQIGAVDTNLNDAVMANETTIAELPDGRVYVNTRDQEGGSRLKNRGETFSQDGGSSFASEIVESQKFPSPIVQASLLAWPQNHTPGANRLFFATPSHPEKRIDLMIFESTDEALHWEPVFKVHSGHSAYSDMVRLDANTMGVIYETDEYKKIRFRTIHIN